jgi:hypothetical protein
MAYPDLDPGRYGAGTPIDITDSKKVWRGGDRTNGFLMRNVDGRVPALKEGFAKAVIGNANILLDPYVIPWGNALWTNVEHIAFQPHTIYAQKPDVSWLQGVLSFEQGWQTGNPVQNYGLPPYSRGTVIRKGYVGYKVALVPGVNIDDNVADYLSFLQGDVSKDVSAVRSVYADWMDMLRVSQEGSRLGLFFENTTGFPVVAVVPGGEQVLAGTPGAAYNQADFSQVTVSGSVPVLAGASFGGFAEILEPENEAIFFDINL